MSLLTARRTFLLFRCALAVPLPPAFFVCACVCFDYSCLRSVFLALRSRARPRAIHRPEFLPAGRGSFNVITCGERSEKLSMYDAASGTTVSRGVLGDEASPVASYRLHHHHRLRRIDVFLERNCVFWVRVRVIVPVLVLPKRRRGPSRRGCSLKLARRRCGVFAAGRESLPTVEEAGSGRRVGGCIG